MDVFWFLFGAGWLSLVVAVLLTILMLWIGYRIIVAAVRNGILEADERRARSAAAAQARMATNQATYSKDSNR